MSAIEPEYRDLQMGPRRRHRLIGKWYWREWCFFVVAFRHFRLRFGLMVIILLGGTLMFQHFEPQHTFVEAMFLTWNLAFGESLEPLPRDFALQCVFFLVPILGLTVIVEGIIDFALMVRDRRRYEKSWCIMLASSLKNHTVLVGFGRLGYRTFLLLRKMGEPVVVIERNRESEFLDDLRRDGSPVLFGDARREALLESANVKQARAIVLATDDDMANLEAALDARKINPKIRVVLRMFDDTIAQKIGEGFGIESAMSEAGLSAPWFATAAIQPSIINSFIVNQQLIVMQRWLVRQAGPLSGRTVGEVINDFGISVVEHRREDAKPVLFPPLDVRLQPGDGLVVQGPFAVIDAIKSKVMSP